MWAVGLIAAFITAFYTFRMIFLTFFGKRRARTKRAITCTRAPGR